MTIGRRCRKTACNARGLVYRCQSRIVVPVPTREFLHERTGSRAGAFLSADCPP